MSLYASVPRYYVSRSPITGRFDLRQTRYREQREHGREHPHDLMATCFSAHDIRGLIANWFPDTDLSALSQ